MVIRDRQRILLLQVPTSHYGAGERVYPVGLARLGSCVPKTMESFGLDLNILPDPWPTLDEQLKVIQPDVVALSFRNIDPLAGHQVSYLPSLITAARLVRRHCPLARILAGGPAFSLYAQPLLAQVPQIDAGIIGEGEENFVQILADAPPSAIPGLIWRENGAIRQNPPTGTLDLKQLPALDTMLFPPSDYLDGNRYVAAVGIEGKRGCDLACTYCVYPQLGGCRMRLRPPKAIVDEIEMLHCDHGVGMFHFTDGVLNRPAGHFEAVCREICRRGLKVGWTGFLREDSLTRQQLTLAQTAGLVAVYFSGDGLSRYGLKLLNKRMTPDHLLRAARITVEAGMLTMCHFMANLPDEREEDFNEGRQLLEQLLEIHAPAGNLGAVIFNPIRLYPGAPLTRRVIRAKQLPDATDLLYPVYYNPLETAHRLHELDVLCQAAGVFSRLGLSTRDPEEVL